MVEKLRFSVEHGVFNTQYLFIIKQQNMLVRNCYGMTEALVTYIELWKNNNLVNSATVVKHVNDKNQPIYAFYKVLNKLVFNHFSSDRTLRTKIFNKFREVYAAV